MRATAGVRAAVCYRAPPVDRSVRTMSASTCASAGSLLAPETVAGPGAAVDPRHGRRPRALEQRRNHARPPVFPAGSCPNRSPSRRSGACRAGRRPVCRYPVTQFSARGSWVSVCRTVARISPVDVREVGVADGLDGAVAASLRVWQASPAAPRRLVRGRDRRGGGLRHGPVRPVRAPAHRRQAPAGVPRRAGARPRHVVRLRGRDPIPRPWPSSGVASATAGPCSPAAWARPLAR